MNEPNFEKILNSVCQKLTDEAKHEIFQTSKQFEDRVREVVQETVGVKTAINFDPHPQAFPDIAIGAYGIEVKFTTNDTWRSVANSVLETNRINEVKKVYLVFGKMGGAPEVKWGEYDKCVMHVRTSHVPRFEVELAAEHSLFEKMGISYDEFRNLPMEEKMKHIRAYARGRLKPGERMWWLEDTPDEPGHTLPIQARLYTKLSTDEKTKLRAEAALLCPQIVQSGRSRDKYDDAVLYLLTYHGVLCHQARDLFSAGSVANPDNDDAGGIYIERALKLIEGEMVDAAKRMEDAIFVEYWGESVSPERRIARWLQKADALADGWTPSESLFVERGRKR
ncbi:MAG: restriction endonuclease [Candidatus Magasanikbacteria bacterium]